MQNYRVSGVTKSATRSQKQETLKYLQACAGHPNHLSPRAPFQIEMRGHTCMHEVEVDWIPLICSQGARLSR